MKTLLISTLYSSLLLICSCSNDVQSNKDNVGKTSPKLTQQKSSLVSGINKAFMDSSVRPQDNFYQYVNGTWLKENEIPASKTTIGSFYDLRDQSVIDVKAIISELANNKTLVLGTDEQKVADLYKAYMDQETRDKLGIKPIQPILSAINNLKNKDELAEFFGRYSSSGIGSPLGLYVGIDEKDSSKYAIQLWQSGTNLPDKDYYKNTAERFVKIRHAYVTHIEKMFTLAQLKKGNNAAKDIMALETALAEKQWTAVENRNRDKTYNKYETNKLHRLSDKFHWANFLTAERVNDQTHIIINQPSFIKGFGEVFAATPLKHWQEYLTYQTLKRFGPYLTTTLDEEYFSFYGTHLSGRKEQRPSWKRGVSVVNANLGEVIGKVYVKRHFAPQAKKRMVDLVENLRDAYSTSITDLDWMSEQTKKEAQKKLAAFTPKIGYPDRWEDYSKLSITSDDLVGNIIRSNKLSSAKALVKLGGPIQKWKWGMTPQTVNAYYNPTVNEIVFPAAILQAPFFNLAADDAVNYGGIGAVIGHEMGHGFDDQGSKYDDQGMLRNWWTENDLMRFTKRTDALVAQYNKFYVFDDLHVNGELTLGENIGDLSGLTIAYKAYQASLKGQAAPIIDGLTGDQRFFIGYTQIWRSKKVEKSLRNQVATDPHSPAEFRALGSLANMDEFYHAFNVKEGDAMYIAPEKRVRIW